MPQKKRLLARQTPELTRKRIPDSQARRPVIAEVETLVRVGESLKADGPASVVHGELESVYLYSIFVHVSCKQGSEALHHHAVALLLLERSCGEGPSNSGARLVRSAQRGGP